MSALPPLLLRADAGGTLGSGHVMRTLALGEAWIDAGGVCVLAASSLPPALEQRIAETSGFLVRRIDARNWSGADAEATAALAAQFAAPVVVADSYRYDEPYLRALQAHGLRVVAI
ncbi:MAG: UDP-2,4-diacetamido-2,4,6-trideoxy-beta-L-altropyranose hydrolase, partial [Pseudomonadota bacterium]